MAAVAVAVAVAVAGVDFLTGDLADMFESSSSVVKVSFKEVTFLKVSFNNYLF